MTIRYDIFDRLYEWTKNYTDLKERRAIDDELAAFDLATRDEHVRYAEGLASAFESEGKDGYAGLWRAFAEEVRRAGQG